MLGGQSVDVRDLRGGDAAEVRFNACARWPEPGPSQRLGRVLPLRRLAALRLAQAACYTHERPRIAMKHADGTDLQLGGDVRIDGRFRGRVVACMNLGACLPEFESWQYLGEGILVDTGFDGLVRYTETARDDIARWRG